MMTETNLIVGYKFLDVQNGVLVGGLGYPLTSRYDEAKCLAGGKHKSPDTHCSCGHHVRWEPDHYYAAMAQVVCYGKVWLHSEGCRAEKIRIDAIYIKPHLAHLKATLEEKYGVPVVVSNA